MSNNTLIFPDFESLQPNKLKKATDNIIKKFEYSDYEINSKKNYNRIIKKLSKNQMLLPKECLYCLNSIFQLKEDNFFNYFIESYKTNSIHYKNNKIAIKLLKLCYNQNDDAIFNLLKNTDVYINDSVVYNISISNTCEEFFDNIVQSFCEEFFQDYETIFKKIFYENINVNEIFIDKEQNLNSFFHISENDKIYKVIKQHTIKKYHKYRQHFDSKIVKILDDYFLLQLKNFDFDKQENILLDIFKSYKNLQISKCSYAFLNYGVEVFIKNKNTKLLDENTLKLLNKIVIKNSIEEFFKKESISHDTRRLTFWSSYSYNFCETEVFKLTNDNLVIVMATENRVYIEFSKVGKIYCFENSGEYSFENIKRRLLSSYYTQIEKTSFLKNKYHNYYVDSSTHRGDWEYKCQLYICSDLKPNDTF